MIARNALALSCAFLLSVSASAQISPSFMQFLRQYLENETRMGAPSDGQEQDVRELVEALRIVRLSQALGLTDKEAATVVRSLGKWKKDLQKLKYERARLERELRADLESAAGEEMVAKKFEALMELDRSIAQSTRRLVEAAGKDLSPVQTAKFYLFLGDFDQELRRMITRAKRHAERDENAGQRLHRRNAPAGPRAPGRPREPVRD